MGGHRRGRVAVAVGLLVTTAASPAYAAGPDPRTQAAVGGPLLARDGIVVHDAPDVRELPKVDASSYMVADHETGRVLAAKDPHGHYRPASTLKILTAVTLIPELDPDDTVRPTQEDCNVEGSKVGLTPELDYPVDDLFRALLMASGNDAALALARGAGGLDETLAKMNATAQRLRAHDTVAKTPNGLDEKGQRSSAYDLALLARYGLEMSQFRDYIATVRADFPAPEDDESYEIANHNRLLRPGPDNFDGAIGVKNGWTSKAKASFVGAAERDGHTIVVALMHSEPYFWKDARQLLRWGFAARDEVVPVGRLVEPKPTATPTPSPDDTAVPPSAAAPAAEGPQPSDSRPLPLMAAGVAAGAAAAVLVGSTTGWFVLVRRRRAPEP